MMPELTDGVHDTSHHAAWALLPRLVSSSGPLRRGFGVTSTRCWLSNPNKSRILAAINWSSERNMNSMQTSTSRRVADKSQ